MRPLSSSPLSSSSLPPTSSVSFYERYEKIFNGCGGCIADEEQEPVASAIIYQHSNDEIDVQEQRNQPTETSSNYCSSYQKTRRRQESPPVETTVLLNHTSFDEIDKFEIEERTSKRQQSKTKAQAQAQAQAKAKAQVEATAVNEYFTGRKNSHRPERHRAIQRSPTTMLTPQQQQRRQQQEHSTPMQSNKTVTGTPTSTSTKQPFSPKMLKPLSSSPKTRLQQYDLFQVVLPSSFRSSLTGQPRQRHRHEEGSKLQYHPIDSDSTQSTQSLSESDDDLSWGPAEEEEQPPSPPQEQQQETPVVVSILRRKVQFGTMIETQIPATNRGRRVVQFEQETQSPDPKERPSSTRKQVPRMSPAQKQEYRMMNTTYYPPTTTDRRQRQRLLDVSSLLMAAVAAVGPSPLVRAPPNKQDEFREYAMTATKKNSPTNMCSSSHPERLARRAQQNQYHPLPQRSRSLLLY